MSQYCCPGRRKGHLCLETVNPQQVTLLVCRVWQVRLETLEAVQVEAVQVEAERVQVARSEVPELEQDLVIAPEVCFQVAKKLFLGQEPEL